MRLLCPCHAEDMATTPMASGETFVTCAKMPEAQRLRALIAAEIEAFADDDSDVSDAYRHAALIAKGTPGA